MTDNARTVVIPAEPGWYTVWGADSKNPFAGQRIIAWLIQTDMTKGRIGKRGCKYDLEPLAFWPIPITLHGSEDDCDGVLSPDGNVTTSGGALFSGLTAYQKALLDYEEVVGGVREFVEQKKDA